MFSGLLPEADIDRGGRHVSNVPGTDLTFHYSISSAARKRNGSGIFNPIDSAVLGLTTNFKFVGCSTGNGREKLDRDFMQQTSRLLLKRKAAINH